MEKTTIDLAFAFDRNYLTPFYVLLTSIFYNNIDERFRLHVIAKDVATQDKEKINHFANTNKATVQFYNIDKEIRGVSFPKRFSYPDATYYRLFFPTIVPDNIEKMLFIDVDAVVIASLADLYKTDLGNRPMGAVVEIDGEIRPELGVVEKYNYLNGGVILFNNKEWKKQHILEKCLLFLQSYPERIKWVDQDVLNAVMANNYYKLEQRYNVRHADIPKDLSPKEYSCFLKDKTIIHYTGPEKPWLMLGKNKLRHLYHFYLKQAPVPLKKRYVDFKFKPPMLYRYYKIRGAELLYNYPRLQKVWRKMKVS